MAQLNSSNIVNGNPIETTDILQLYDALTSGGGTTGAYNVSLSGSLTGSATSSSYALSASYAVSSSRTVSSSYALSSSYSVSSSYALSSSYSVTASYATNGGLATQVYQQQFERLSGGAQDATFKYICGSAQASGGVATTSAFSLLSGKTLGINVFVTATINANSATAGNIVVVKALSGGALTFNTAGGSGTEIIFYQAFILQ